MRFLIPLLFGVLGCAVLAGLGIWQLQRLDQKDALLADLQARIAAEPGRLPLAPNPEDDRYRPVAVTGNPAGMPLRVLVSQKAKGAGYRIISPMRLPDGRVIMADLGIVPTSAPDTPLPPGPYEITGNLHWPDEVDGFTPAPDGTLWFARDVPAMAATLGTEPVLVIARTVSPDIPPTPLPVGVEGIPNNHLGYAIQWFGLAAVWLGMTAFLLWRIRRRTL